MRQPAERALLLDVGGVLCSDGLPAVTATWSRRLGISAQSVLQAVYADSDEGVLVGRQSEDAWWQVVADRLGIGDALLSGLRDEITSAGAWDDQLLDVLASLRGQVRVAIVSNAWPHLRVRLAEQHIDEVADTVVLSCEVGYAKPDPRIFRLVLDRFGVTADKALFSDDAPGHVAAAITAGLHAHLHTSRTSTIAAIRAFLRDRP
jgi:putative hydrolase of the HAD superfamily